MTLFPVGTEWVLVLERLSLREKRRYPDTSWDYSLSLCGNYFLPVKSVDGASVIEGSFPAGVTKMDLTSYSAWLRMEMTELKERLLNRETLIRDAELDCSFQVGSIASGQYLPLLYEQFSMGLQGTKSFELGNVEKLLSHEEVPDAFKQALARENPAVEIELIDRTSLKLQNVRSIQVNSRYKLRDQLMGQVSDEGRIDVEAVNPYSQSLGLTYQYTLLSPDPNYLNFRLSCHL